MQNLFSMGVYFLFEHTRTFYCPKLENTLNDLVS